MSKADEFEDEIQVLAKKYNMKIFYISIIPEENDTDTISFCGNICFVCAKESLEEHIKIEGITHITGIVH